MLAHFVRYRTHVGSRSHAGLERGSVAFDSEDGEFPDLHLYRLQDNLFLFSGQLVSGHTVNFLGGKRRWNLLDEAEESGCEFLDLLQTGVDWADLTHRIAIGIVGIGGEAE